MAVMKKEREREMGREKKRRRGEEREEEGMMSLLSRGQFVTASHPMAEITSNTAGALS